MSTRLDRSTKLDEPVIVTLPLRHWQRLRALAIVGIARLEETEPKLRRQAIDEIDLFNRALLLARGGTLSE